MIYPPVYSLYSLGQCESVMQRIVNISEKTTCKHYTKVIVCGTVCSSIAISTADSKWCYRARGLISQLIVGVIINKMKIFLLTSQVLQIQKKQQPLPTVPQNNMSAYSQTITIQLCISELQWHKPGVHCYGVSIRSTCCCADFG